MKTILLLIALSGSLFAQCSKERGEVKSLTDVKASQINLANVIKSTIKILVHKHTINPKPSDERFEAEDTAYIVPAEIMGFKQEIDGDFHIVLNDPVSHDHLIAEIPNPDCPSVKVSKHATEYREARSWFVQHIGKPSAKYKALGASDAISVNVVGVASFDHAHKQTGASINNIEIHPVLKFLPFKQ